MGRRFTVLAAATLLAASAAGVTGIRTALPAHANDAGYSQLCAANNDFFFGSHGACVAALHPNDDQSSYFAAFCRSIPYPNVVLDIDNNPYPVTNQGDCVSTLNQILKPLY